MKKYILAGTGSRSLQTASREVKQAVLKQIGEEIVKHKQFAEENGLEFWVMSGMAEGFDKALALMALELDINLVLAIPNKGYGKYYWGKNSLTGTDMYPEFEKIVSQAQRVVYVMEEIHKTNSLKLDGLHANFVRNNYMVDRADSFLVYDPSSSGTGQCFASIKKANKPFVILNKEGI